MQPIDEVISPGEHIAFASYLGGKCYAHHWAIYEGPADEHEDGGARLHRLTFLTEIDQELIGLGGPLIQIRAKLLCRADLYPRFYRVETKDSVNTMTVGEQSYLTLPDGSQHPLTDTDFRCVLGENLCQLALFLKLVHEELGSDFHAPFFSLGGASVFKYTLTRAAAPEDAEPGARRYSSSFFEELSIDRDGWLVRHDVPREGVTSVREVVPLPEWRDQPLVRRPLSYSPPPDVTFALEDVQVPGPSTPVGVTLTIPAAGGPHPVALFLSGSGSHDRHGIAGQIDLGSHELVDYLSGHGWMGARFDTRGTGSTKVGEDFLEMGVDELIGDARAVLDYLLRRPDVDRNHVALIGHSQGGLIACELALAVGGVSRVVLMAMAGRSVEDILRDQIVVRARWLNQTEEQVRAQIAELEEFVALARSDQEWTQEHVPERFYVAKRLRKWYADHLHRDPLKMIAQLKCPVLICQGAKDFQVSLEKDALALHRAAADAGVAVELAVYGDLDHLFKPVEGESHISQYYDLSRKVSPALKRRVLEFLDADLAAAS